uniref:NADH-ubiquinone oxidoreductase chain 2 n=1 Tax=Batillaria cumingii TaxID=149336 RepID=D6RTM6_9CAEN|nr:NADH dehydrogenase subunit 2 [Batillaria cumingii]
MFSGLPFSYMFLIVMFFGTMFSLSSSHWLGIWAGVEINLIGFLPLLVYQKSMLESESAVKYFIVQALGSSFLIFGSLFSYSLSFSWESFSHLDSLVPTGGTFLALGLLVKMGVFPFHFWFPSVMAGLSWFSCFLLATWQKVAPAFLMLGILNANLLYLILFSFYLLSAGSSLIGGLGGMNQTQIRALLAYSSIGHMGWILFAICSGESSMKIYFSIYVLISFCVFFSLWVLDSGNFKNLGSLSKGTQKSTLGFMVMLLSLGGLPPLLGFISKWAVISTGVSFNSWGILFFLILGSLMSLFYYLSLFFSEILSLKVSLINFSEEGSSLKTLAVNLGVTLNFLGGILLVLFLPVKFI